MSSSLTVTGGTAETRTQLLHSRSAELIEKFMREGETHPALIVLLELLKKLRIPSSFGSSIVADKSSVDLVSPGPNVTYKKKGTEEV